MDSRGDDALNIVAQQAGSRGPPTRAREHGGHCRVGSQTAKQAVATEDEPRALALPVHDPDTGGLLRGVQLLGPVVGGPHRLPSSAREACRPALTPELQRGAAWVPQVILSMANR